MLLSTNYKTIFLLHKLQLEFMSIIVIYVEVSVKKIAHGMRVILVIHIRSPTDKEECF